MIRTTGCHKRISTNKCISEAFPSAGNKDTTLGHKPNYSVSNKYLHHQCRNFPHSGNSKAPTRDISDLVYMVPFGISGRLVSASDWHIVPKYTLCDTTNKLKVLLDAFAFLRRNCQNHTLLHNKIIQEPTNGFS